MIETRGDAESMAMITTVQQHILQQQQAALKATGREASGTFSWLLSGITLATKMIEARIRAAGLSDVYGAFGAENVQGEQQQKLDVYANQALLHCLGLRDSVAALVSEEDEEPVTFNRDAETGKYIIVFDPLDGSSNIDVNVNVGTIFSVLRACRRSWGRWRSRFCNRGFGRSRLDMWCMGRRRCWFIRRGMACTDLRLIRRLARLY